MRLFPLVAALLVAAPLAAQVPSPDIQIAGAVQPLPEADRATATVIGYRNYGRLAVLREGTGTMVCLADDPSAEAWHVACYHKDLEPFMARGRELEAQGMKRPAIDSVRLAEITAKTLPFPDGPRALINLSAPKDSIDAATGIARSPRRLDVVYVPYATAASVGFPERPGVGPWLMYPGKPWAHLMIMR